MFFQNKIFFLNEILFCKGIYLNGSHSFVDILLNCTGKDVADVMSRLGVIALMWCLYPFTSQLLNHSSES